MVTIQDGVSRLLRPDVAGLVPYAAPPSLEEFAASRGVAVSDVVKLDQNENPYGCSPRVREALGRFDWYHVYPDPEHRALRDRLGEYAGVDPASVIIGNGSDELIELILRLFVEAGDRVLGPAPTFAYYATAAQAAGAEYVAVPRGASFEVDPDVVAAAVDRQTKIVLLASPNNPTGNLTPLETIRRLVELDLVVVVDEAYYEFCGQTAVGLIADELAENVIVLRTFSKWAGLAGLRLGYGIFPKALVAPMRSVKPPYSVGQAAEVAGLASLDDLAYLRSTVARLVAERERLKSGLDELSYLRTYPSDANFLFCDVVGRSAADVQRALASRAILVRRYESPRLENGLRITVGRPEQTDQLLAVLREIR